MRNGTVSKSSCQSGHHVADCDDTLSARSSTPSFICCAPAALGAICPATFRHGRPCTTISSSFAAPASGRACTERCETPNVGASAKTPIRARQAIIDAQSVKTVEESGCIRGFDAHTWIKGRKRHLLVDTLGLPLSVYVSPADMHDTQGARRLLAGLKYFVPRLKKIWADAAYRGQELADWCKAVGDWEFAVSAAYFPWRTRIRCATQTVGRGTDLLMALAESRA